jgi:hypothetical protein
VHRERERERETRIRTNLTFPANLRKETAVNVRKRSELGSYGKNVSIVGILRLTQKQFNFLNLVVNHKSYKSIEKKINLERMILKN